MEDVTSIRELERQLEDVARRTQRVTDLRAEAHGLRYHLFTPVDIGQLDALVEATLCAEHFNRADHGDHWVFTLVERTGDRKRVPLSLMETAPRSWDYIDLEER